MDTCNFFAGLQLDRRGDARAAQDWRRALNHPDALYIVSSGTRQLVRRGDEPRIVFASNHDTIVQRAQDHQLTLLGWAGDAPYVLLDAGLDGAAPIPAGWRDGPRRLSTLPREVTSNCRSISPGCR